MRKIEFTYAQLYGDRRYYISEEDVKIVLSRLPQEIYLQLRAVHFDDRSRGVRTLGYTTKRGRREITICALPPRVSLSRFLVAGQSAGTFGAKIGQQWSQTAVRRFLLYDVLLHEIGHLQIIKPSNSSFRLKFAGETKAQEFADFWRKQLWKERFEHKDLVHNAPTVEELV
ncbi:MAG: hypothetical protein ABJA66_13600 [Actinomycetota bacterium]